MTISHAEQKHSTKHHREGGELFHESSHSAWSEGRAQSELDHTFSEGSAS